MLASTTAAEVEALQSKKKLKLLKSICTMDVLPTSDYSKEKVDESDSGYWQTIDTQFDQRMHQIHEEKRLIHEVGLDVSTTIRLTTGYCSAAQLMPGVKLNSKFQFVYEKANIFFDKDDWYYFVSLLEKMWKDYQGSEKTADVHFSYYTLHCTQCIGTKVISIYNCYATLYLDQHSINKILKYKEMIQDRLQILISNNFASEYDGFLRNTLDVLERISEEPADTNMTLDVIKLMCKNTEASFRYCFTECLHLVPEKVLADLEKIRYYQFPNSTTYLR